jgi:hypothetical protein
MKQLLRGRSGRKNTAQATHKIGSDQNNKFGWNSPGSKFIPKQSSKVSKQSDPKPTKTDQK